MERLFIYGTLAPGRVNHKFVEDISGEWQTATLRGKLIKLGWGADMGYPAIIPSDDGEEVEGFILSSDELSEHWARLDEFEGSEYSRVEVTVKDESGEQLKAFVYALNNAEELES